MPNIWLVSSGGGMYIDQMINGAFAGIDTLLPEYDHVPSRDEIHRLLWVLLPPGVARMEVRAVENFLLDMKPGDYVITQTARWDWLRYGAVTGPYYYAKARPTDYVSAPGDGCPFHYRRPVEWAPEQLCRGDFSDPFQNTLQKGSSVFLVGDLQRREFLAAISKEFKDQPPGGPRA